MKLYDEAAVLLTFTKALADARARLAQIEVYSGDPVSFGGFNGWVFEETVRFCLRRELDALGNQGRIESQVKLRGRVKVDLLVGGVVFVELKAGGLFGKADADKYAAYRALAEQANRGFLFLSVGETHPPYRAAIIEAVSAERAFFLDTPGDWARFVSQVASHL